MTSIYEKVFYLLEKETTKISRKAFDILSQESIADIVESDKVFWFESYSYGNACPNYIYDYLVRFIKKKLGLKYLYELK